MTPKNKILTISLSVLSVIVLFVVLSSTVFTVKKIEVNWLSSKNELFEISNKTIVSESGLNYGTNVFFVGKQSSVDKLEKKYPYIKIENIETVFPNKLIIHAQERQEVFAVNLEGCHLILDSQFKVLKKVSGEFISSSTNAILIGGDFNFSQDAGEKLTITQNMVSLAYLEDGFYKNRDENETSQNLTLMKNFLKSVQCFDTKLIFQTFLGVKIEIYNPTLSLQKKVAMLNYVFSTLDENQKQTGTIIIGDRNGKVQGSYTKHE